MFDLWKPESRGAGLARLEPSSAAGKLTVLTLWWSLVGIVWGLQEIATAAIGSGSARPWTELADGWVSGLVWVPITLLIVALHRRFPIQRDRWRRTVVVHLLASLAVPFLYNLVVPLLRPDGASEGWLASAATGYLRWLHITVAVYWAILALDRWRFGRAPADVAEASGFAGERDSEDERSLPLTRVPIRKNGRIRVIETERIAWIEGAGDYVRIHSDDGTFLASKRLADLAERLDPRTFFRIHRSTIVNLDRIRSYRPLGHGDYRVILRGGEELRVSRTRGNAFRERLEL